VLEGSVVNMDVTSPGATLALALMFLKTNDAAIASAFAIPDTHFALDYVRSDFILLRLLGRSLVMWDSVEPSVEWVTRQLPPLLQVRAALCRAVRPATVCLSVCRHAPRFSGCWALRYCLGPSGHQASVCLSVYP
jgi:hypothetical protein